MTPYTTLGSCTPEASQLAALATHTVEVAVEVVRIGRHDLEPAVADFATVEVALHADRRDAPLDHDPHWLTVVDEATGERYGADETGTFRVGTVIPGGRVTGTIHVPLPSTAHQIRVTYATPYGDLVWTDRRPSSRADHHVHPSSFPGSAVSEVLSGR